MCRTYLARIRSFESGQLESSANGIGSRREKGQSLKYLKWFKFEQISKSIGNKKNPPSIIFLTTVHKLYYHKDKNRASFELIQHYFSIFLELTSDDRVECVRHLLALLNPPNIDTLFVLMKFLHQVSLNCSDRYDDGDETLARIFRIFSSIRFFKNFSEIFEHISSLQQLKYEWFLSIWENSQKFSELFHFVPLCENFTTKCHKII